MTVKVLHGDCVAILTASDELFDACVTDPPYELGFMGKAWDSSGVAFRVETWRAIFDKLKPGAHLVAFSGTRTYHRMAVAIEDAGFEIRDQLAWAYGSGFPKSLDVSKAIDKAAGARGHDGSGFNAAGRGRSNGGDVFRSDHPDYVRPQAVTFEGKRWQGWGTALKPAWEPICLARKPLIGTVAANVLAHGTGGLNIDASRIGETGARNNGRSVDSDIYGKLGKFEKTEYGKGRFPANLLHDGSDEVLAGFPEAMGATSNSRMGKAGLFEDGLGSQAQTASFGDNGTAARFFYSAKAGPLDRIGSAHATVKPVDVMRWLARLITPPGGHLLDPFGGSGTTGIAAIAEGFDATLIELEAEHVADIERKLAFLRGEGKSRVEEHRKRKAENAHPADPLPLFD